MPEGARKTTRTSAGLQGAQPRVAGRGIGRGPCSLPHPLRIMLGGAGSFPKRLSSRTQGPVLDGRSGCCRWYPPARSCWELADAVTALRLLAYSS